MEKTNILVDNYKKVWKFLRHTRGIFYTTTAIFLIFIILGLAGAMYSNTLRQALAGPIAELMSNISPDDTATDMFIFIFLNNLRAMTIMIALGFVPFLFLPAIALASNGGMMGYIGAISWEQGMNLGAFLGYLVPHGIIELPILILCCSMGFYLCLSLTQKIVSEVSLKQRFLNVVRVYVLVALPGILAAALIESYVTPLIGAMFM